MLTFVWGTKAPNQKWQTIEPPVSLIEWNKKKHIAIHYVQP